MLHKAQMVVMSHLSDAQELIGIGRGDEASKRINFAKFIMFKCSGDLNTEINLDELWDEFSKRF
jgi:hypothetical protein